MRRRVLLVGSTCWLVTSALYGVYMVGAEPALDHAAELPWLRVGVAAIAGGFASLISSGLRAAKPQEQHGRALHLVSGALMVSLAAAMLWAPDLLGTLTGTLVVIGLAGVLAVLIQVWTRANASGSQPLPGTPARSRGPERSIDVRP